MKSNDTIIHVEDLTVAYDEQPVLFDVDIDFIRGSKTAIIGPNGAGKSTLIKAMLGFIKPITGNITYAGEPIAAHKAQISYVPQSESVNWDFPISVLEVVMMGRFDPSRRFSRFDRTAKAQAIEALDKVGMADFARCHISELSGGQKRRVFIARSLNHDAETFILDEPFAGVDKETEQIIAERFRTLQAEGKTILVVHHDLNTLANYFDHLVIIDKVVKAQGPLDEVLAGHRAIDLVTRSSPCQS